MPIDLYYLEASAPCRSVMMTAKMVGVELNLKKTDVMAGDNMKPEYIKMNPQHNIPTIDDDGFYLNESRAICAYLVNKYGKDDTLYPKDPKVRALVDQRLYFDMGVFYHRFGLVYYPVMLKGATKIDESAMKDLEGALDFLETFLGQNKYAACDHLTIADLSLVASASTFLATNKTIFDKHPKIQSWLETCKAEITDYEDTNNRGAEAFGQWAGAALSKLESA
ncbi:glutathione S-transferase 1-like [Daphnia pulicaria]|uniref:glutathione S-transferase 1-like n=1 Tax=Daphnia pulicaria TaxID=35523 RepID=UPI001EEB81B0|nr:glutathione S-transferase 1-like [Daphnia pulicaria]